MPWGPDDLPLQVLDPDELDHFLSTIRRQLREERSPFELAFNHTYHFYAEPMVMFTNTHDQITCKCSNIAETRHSKGL